LLATTRPEMTAISQITVREMPEDKFACMI